MSAPVYTDDAFDTSRRRGLRVFVRIRDIERWRKRVLEEGKHRRNLAALRLLCAGGVK